MNNIPITDILARGDEFDAQGKHEQAYECYRYAFEKDKANEDTLTKLALSSQSLGKKDEAIGLWNALIALNPQNELPYNQLLDLYFTDNKYDYYMTRAKLKTVEGRLEQATSDYKKAVSNTSEDEKIITARYLLGQTYELIDKPMQAIDEYLRVLDYSPNEHVFNSLANIYYKTDKSAAVDVLNQAIEKFPANTSFKDFLSKVYMELGDYDKALQYSVDKLSQAKALLMQEKNAEAILILEQLTQEEKNSPRYLTLMAEYYYNTGNDDEALRYIEAYEKIDADSPLAYQMKALVYENKNNDYEAHYNWGKYYLKKGSPDIALNEFLSAHYADIKQVNALKELISLYVALDDKIASIEFSEKLVQIEKDDVATLKKLVNFYDEQGYQEKTIEYLTMLNEINPKDYDALLRLGKYAESNRQIDEALRYYQNYLKFAPTSDEREKIENKVNMMTTGEGYEEEGFLDKLMGLFSKK